VLRRLSIIILLAALALAACGGAAPTAQQVTAPAAPAPTTAPTSRSTLAPPPTPVPTQPPAPTAQPAPPTQPPAPTAQPAAEPPTQPPAPTAAPQPTVAARPTTLGSEILFLRNRALIAFDTGTRKERQIADSVRDFTPAPGGAQIALLRGEGRQAEIWLVRRDGSALAQLTRNNRAEATLGWAPDGGALVFGSSSTAEPYMLEWIAWSAWCANSEVHLLTLSDSTETSFGPGCDPAFSPDGKRIAYAAPPKAAEPGIGNGPTIVNSIRLINRQGQNGWDFAKAAGVEAPPPHTGRVVYAPAWSPDGARIIYHRFLGYQALVDIDITEVAGSFEGQGQPLADGAGWLLPARFAPDGRMVAIVENNAGDARGFGGYDNWSVSVTNFDGAREIAMPSGPLTAIGQHIDQLPRGQSAAWAPDGGALAVQLPPDWNARLDPNQPVNADGQPGEIWRWRPGSPPEELLIKGVDFASPLAWLPPA
jgi:hypothetical protein